MYKRLLAVAGALSLVAMIHSATAQEATPPNDEVPSTDPMACPPGQAPQPYVAPAPAPQAYMAPAPAPIQPARRDVFSPLQTSLSLGGGVAGFSRSAIADAATTQGAWDARLTFGTRSWIGFEAGYLGSAGQAEDPFANRTISTTQVAGNLRFNMLPKFRVQPFITGGAGWANLHRWGSATESPVAAANFAENANSLVVPVGGGLATYLGRHGVLDARFDYRFITDKSFTTTTQRPDMWVAELRAGYAF